MVADARRTAESRCTDVDARAGVTVDVSVLPLLVRLGGRSIMSITWLGTLIRRGCCNEAARVGVKGRGFSVIAAEMQRFSTRAVEIAGQLGVFTVAAQESKEAATALHDGFEGARREAEHLAAEVESLTTDNSAVEEVPGELTELGDSIEALSSRASYFDEVSDKLDRIAVLTEPYSTG